MSTTPKNTDNQDIDLSEISIKIRRFFDSLATGFFGIILFFRKRALIFIVLILTGGILGYFIDRETKIYESEVIVSPNFGSVDYLYAQVELLESKLTEQDTLFFKSIGVKNPKQIVKIEIEPVIDIYNFVASNTANVNNAQNTQNFELIKLLSEDGDVNKVITGKITSRNYSRHSIIITSKGKISNKETVDPLLVFMNQNKHYQNIQKVFFENIKVKIKQNQNIIAEINNILNQFSLTSSTSQKSNSLVYYNDNTQLNDIIKTKNNLTQELGTLSQDLISFNDVIVKNSDVLNIINNKGLNSKTKLILPLFFIFIYLAFYFFGSFYRNQTEKVASNK